MDAACAAGWVYRPGEGFAEGWVLHDARRVIDAGEGAAPRPPDVHGILLPAPVNAHTHVGDHVARSHDLRGLSLAEVVAPPDGLKHRVLRETPTQQLVDGMRHALREIVASGCRTFLDFREGGVHGVDLLAAAAEGLPLEPIVLGRCAHAWSDEEAEEVLTSCDGFGLSGLADLRGDTPERAAKLAHARDKLVALHLSEERREDAGRALDLGPDMLVHGVHATRDDLRAIAAARVPLVVCPRSNARFGALPDVPAMLDAGVVLAIGTDNAMFHELDVWLDVRELHERFPKVPRAALLDALVVGGRLAARGSAPRSWLRKGDAAELVVLEPRGHDPWQAVFGPERPRVLTKGSRAGPASPRP